MIAMTGYTILTIFLVAVFVIILARGVNWWKYRITSKDGIEESGYLEINGIKEFVQIRGEHVDNPVIIFIHGGPASPMSYAAPYYQQGLEDDYTIINYDQRGCGRTYYANSQNSGEMATADLLEEDLDGLVEYAREKFGQDKVILMGHSWGTVLGTRYITEHPDKISAYVGISQITSLYQDKIQVSRQALEIAEATDSEDAARLKECIRKMEQVKEYSEFNLQDLMESVTLSAKYLKAEGEISGLHQIWIGISSPMMNLTDVKWFLKQSDTASFFAMEKEVMDYAFFGFNIRDYGCEYQVPVYYIAGDSDYSVAQSRVEEFYQTVSAPDKEFVYMKNVGHSMFVDDPDGFCSTVKSLLKSGGEK